MKGWRRLYDCPNGSHVQHLLLFKKKKARFEESRSPLFSPHFLKVTLGKFGVSCSKQKQNKAIFGYVVMKNFHKTSKSSLPCSFTNYPTSLEPSLGSTLRPPFLNWNLIVENSCQVEKFGKSQ